MATALHPEYGNMLLVRRRLWRIMLTPQGRGGETGDKEDIHKFENTWDICLTPTCRNAYAYRRLANSQSSYTALFYSADVSFSVF